MESQGRIVWALKSTEEREGDTDDGFAIVTAVLMSVPDRQQGMDDINRTIQRQCA